MAEVYLVRLEDAQGRLVQHRDAETPDLLDVIDQMLAESYQRHSQDHGWFPQGWRLIVERDA